MKYRLLLIVRKPRAKVLVVEFDTPEERSAASMAIADADAGRNEATCFYVH